MDFHNRDVQIMRQSQSKMALEYLNSIGVLVTFEELQRVTDVFVDECAEVSKRCVDILQSRIRYNLVNDKPKCLMTCNPSKGWVFMDFFSPSSKGELEQNKAFVQALLTDKIGRASCRERV